MATVPPASNAARTKHTTATALLSSFLTNQVRRAVLDANPGDAAGYQKTTKKDGDLRQGRFSPHQHHLQANLLPVLIHHFLFLQ